jgi:hypothetical protein
MMMTGTAEKRRRFVLGNLLFPITAADLMVAKLGDIKRSKLGRGSRGGVQRERL